ncbi:MFS transporter [Paenibacillus sp. SYP-B3998]|uniref:MFS transporter n=1 Tax=Paenibacillus sp. SYP-B3998 TaxID=2678564 RepID=A0A6G4A4J3_9BACL|nr:MFS transporter [Paenibacillus sp. SYP-B3998]NEW09208.1 MFS transporter [Paenibacillus sp. SYP-B3998]
MNMFQNMSKAQRIGLSLVIAILFIDMLLYSLLIPMIPYFTEKLNPSSTMMGILFSSYAVALFITTPLFGWLSDRIGRKTPMIMGLLGLALSTCLFVYAENMTLLISARFIQGIAAAASWTAALALLADLFPGKSRGPVMGIAMTGISTGSLLGAPIGGWLFELGGFRMPFFCAATLILVTIAASFLFLKESARTKSTGTKEGSSLLRNRSVLYIAAVVLLAEISLTLLEPLLPVFLTERLAVTPLEIGLLIGAMTLAYGAMAPISGAMTSRFNPLAMMLLGLAGLAVSMPFIVLSQSFWQEVAVLVVVGGMIGFTLSPALSSLGSIVDEGGESGDYGSAYALFNMFHAIGMIIGPLIGGVLTDLITIPTAIIAVSIIILAFTVMLFGMLSSINRAKANIQLPARK